MANINLLPWRADRRKLREREFYMSLLGAAVAAFAVLLLAIMWMGHLVDVQNDRNAYLQDEIKNLDKQIVEIAELDKTRSQLLTRKEIIEQLQSNRSQMVHLFDDMVKTIPDGARLTAMKQAGDILTLEGVAESNSRVASYMRNIDVAPWMGRTDLRKIENKAGGKDVEAKMPYVFSLDVKLHKPEVQDAEQIEAQNAAAAASANGQTPAAPVAPVAGQPAAIAKPAGNATGAGNPIAPVTAPAPAATTPATGEKK